MLSLLRLSCLALLVGLIASVWHSRSVAIDEKAEREYRQQLRALQLDQTLLAKDVLESRAGLVTHYDNLVRRIAALRAHCERLTSLPRNLSASAHSEIEAGIAGYLESLSQQEELIESFKFDHAVLRNSLRYFPGEALAQSERLKQREEGQDLATLLSELYSAVLLDYLFGESQVVTAVHERARAIANDGQPWLDDEDQNSLAILVRHAEVIMTRKPKVDTAIERMLSIPITAQIQGLSELYSRHYRSAAQRASRARILSWVMALAWVLASAAYIILRLRQSGRALAKATTELERAMDSLALEKEKHKELAELKSRFVSMTSHEFRTPLSVVMSSAELLQVYGDRWSEEKKQNHLIRVQNAATYMKQMLDEVLLIGRAEAGKLESQPRSLDVLKFCEELVESLRLQYDAEREVTFSAKGDLHARAIDSQLLTHILDNLLSNALKYSESSTKVHLEVCTEDGDLVFSVHDEGIGIAEEDQANLFETFHRGGNVGEISGTGLGLAVVKKSLDVLGGSITWDSKLGKGSTFVVRVPATPVEQAGMRDSA